MESELLLKFTGYFPDFLSALLRYAFMIFWTTFVETAVYSTVMQATSDVYDNNSGLTTAAKILALFRPDLDLSLR